MTQTGRYCVLHTLRIRSKLKKRRRRLSVLYRYFPYWYNRDGPFTAVSALNNVTRWRLFLSTFSWDVNDLKLSVVLLLKALIDNRLTHASLPNVWRNVWRNVDTRFDATFHATFDANFWYRVCRIFWRNFCGNVDTTSWHTFWPIAYFNFWSDIWCSNRCSVWRRVWNSFSRNIDLV